MEQSKEHETLHQASPEQLLEAAINAYSKSYPDIDIDKWMQLGFRIAQSDGWREVAPAWLEDLIKLETPF